MADKIRGDRQNNAINIRENTRKDFKPDNI
jgi:hypothetical protein